MSTGRASAIEARALAAERSIDGNRSAKGALEAAITSAELYMQALKLSDKASDRKRLNTRLGQALAKAESLKNHEGREITPATQSEPIDKNYPISTRGLKTREEIILLEGSKLNGFVFKPWKQPPGESEFELRPGEDPYTEPALSLSEDQQKSFAGWERGSDAIRRIKMYKDGALLPNDPIMVLPGRPDLVQDMASDCSVVASLCAGAARAEKGHTRILGTILYPYEVGEERVKFSANGRYVVRFYFNGCWRRVDIDDYLPTSKTSRVLHVVDRSHPGLLWPAFVEKAYLKVRGGYDFPGSNSGTDLAVFTGWIPQQVFLHDEDVDQNALWEEIIGAFENGHVLLTIGTGKLSRREQKQLGLAAEHDYAILDLKYRDGIKEMLIKNPWSDGEVWKGAARRRPNPNHEDDDFVLHPPADDSVEMLPGTFWMDYNSIFHHFENMYINWNPGLFSKRQDMHFSWQVPETSIAPNICLDNPQFTVRSSQAGDIWLLLNRHFRTGDYTHENSGKNGYISLYLFDKTGYRVLSTEGAKARGPFVDSPNTLLRFHAQANTAYTAVVVTQDLPVGKHNFTLTALSQSVIGLSDAPSCYQQHIRRSAAWNRDTAGGNTDSPQYLHNPQFTITISERNTATALVLRLVTDQTSPIDQSDVHVKLLMLYSPSQDRASQANLSAHRIDKLRSRDIVASSGDYRRGCAVIETQLQPSTYTIICSTFETSQLAKFTLDLYTSSPAQSGTTLTPVPSETSGRISTISSPAVFNEGVSRLIAPLTIPRLTKARVIARAKYMPSTSNSSTNTNTNFDPRSNSLSTSTSTPTPRPNPRSTSTSALYRLSLLQGHPSTNPYAHILVSSSSSPSPSALSSASNATDPIYTSIYPGLRIPDTVLTPSSSTNPMNAGINSAGVGGGNTPLYIAIDRPSQAVSESHAGVGAGGFYLEVEILAEERVVVGEWVAL